MEKQPRPQTRLPREHPAFRAPSKTDIRKLIDGRWSRPQVAQIVGVGERSVYNWLNGASPISYAAWRLLLIRAGLALEQPEEVTL